MSTDSKTEGVTELLLPDLQDTWLAPAIRLWLGAQWHELLDLDEGGLRDEDKGHLSAMKAAVSFRLGDFAEAKSRIEVACERGFPRHVAGRMLFAMMHHTLGCALACLEEEEASRAAFVESLQPFGAALVDLRLAARHHQICSLASIGLLTTSHEMLMADNAKAGKGASPTDAMRIRVMQSEIDMLGHELSLALQRSQIMSSEVSHSPRVREIQRLSTSQLGQDLWVLRKTGFKRGGFFVEFGATDGVRLSNTYLLESEFDWNGICAEPNPKFFKSLIQNRRCIVTSDCVSGETGKEVDFVFANEFGGILEYAFSDQHSERRGNFQGTEGVKRVPTISLHDLLKKHGAPEKIDYLSVDTEGSEYEILKNFPFNEWEINFITVEHNWTPMREKISELLCGLGYRRTEANFDDWYER